MASVTTKPDLDVSAPFSGAGMPPWPHAHSESGDTAQVPSETAAPQRASQRDALQALLAFAALHEQVRRRKALATKQPGFDAGAPISEFDEQEQFVLDEVLQLVAERAISITGADGLAI